jgi:hypothetical protein
VCGKLAVSGALSLLTAPKAILPPDHFAVHDDLSVVRTDSFRVKPSSLDHFIHSHPPRLTNAGSEKYAS